MSRLPDAETVARMKARGWTWEPCTDLYAGGSFAVSAGTRRDGSSIIRMRAVLYSANRPEDTGWGALYGTPGVGFERRNRYPTPDPAADEAEAWLRGVLADLRFPWLRVDP